MFNARLFLCCTLTCLHTRPRCFWVHTQVLWYSHSSWISAKTVFYLFFMLWFQAIRCGTRGKPMHSSHFAPPCFSAMTSSSMSVSSLRFLKAADGWTPLQTAFLVGMPTANKCYLLFLGALCFFQPHASLESMARVCMSV